MASEVPQAAEQQAQPRIQIYPTTGTAIPPYWRDKYERDAKKYWDIFYKRHQDKFFKDRHYLEKEWGHYFTGTGAKIFLEVGCGVGNTLFPLLATFSDVFVHACDFSPRAIDLVKAHKEFTETRINAFVCDLTSDDLSQMIAPSSVDIVTMIFVLSAVSPEKMHLVLQNVRHVLKPNGCVLFRDYATGDLAQERLTCKDQKISENFYVRGDGTRAFYFSEEYLTSLFDENGFEAVEVGLCCKQVENRSRELVMDRRWIQAVFSFPHHANGSDKASSIKDETMDQENEESEVEKWSSMELVNGNEVDMSEGMAVEMFGAAPSDGQIIDFNLGSLQFKIKVLSKEYQHTCKSTGLILWESARLMARVLAENPAILTGKKVLELGCGCAGICSMIAARFADMVVATDGDAKALELLHQNIDSNLTTQDLSKLVVRTVEWGNAGHIEGIKSLNGKGFDVIIGTDVTYVPEAIIPLFTTAKRLISSNDTSEPALIFCHVFRRVDEPSLLAAASQCGFRLVDKWPGEPGGDFHQSIISSWFPNIPSGDALPSTALNIMVFRRTDALLDN